jgi:hypothetical protein
MNRHIHVFFIASLVFFPLPAAAYIGPGAGILLLGPMFAMVAAIGVAILMVLLWPFMAWRRKRKKSKESASAGAQSSSETPNQQ